MNFSQGFVYVTGVLKIFLQACRLHVGKSQSFYKCSLISVNYTSFIKRKSYPRIPYVKLQICQSFVINTKRFLHACSHLTICTFENYFGSAGKFSSFFQQILSNTTSRLFWICCKNNAACCVLIVFGKLPQSPIKMRDFHKYESCLLALSLLHNSREDGGKQGNSHFDEKLSF